MKAVEKRILRSKIDAVNPCAILAIRQVNLYKGRKTRCKVLHSETVCVNIDRAKSTEPIQLISLKLRALSYKSTVIASAGW